MVGNEILYAKELCLWLERLVPPAGLELGTARSAGQHLT